MVYQGDMLSKTLVIGILILLIGMSVVSSTGNLSKSSFICKSNNPPYEPSDPIPPDGATNWTGGGLCWTGGDPDGDLVVYDVYLGNCSPPPKIIDNQSGNCTDLPWGWFDYNTTYYWKVVAWDGHGASTEGPIWSFTTEPNYSPDPAHDPIPPDGAINVPGDAILYWNSSDPNTGDTLTYDVFFCICFPPVLVNRNQSGTYYDPYGTNDMPLFEEYYWRIVTWDSEGEFTSSPIWSFTTQKEPNDPPTSPDIYGPPSGSPGIELCWAFISDDPNEHQIKYVIEWGDGESTETEFSTIAMEAYHTYEEEGEFILRAKAIDTHEAESDWTTLEVSMPKNKPFYFNHPIFNWLFEHFPNIFPVLRYILGQ